MSNKIALLYDDGNFNIIMNGKIVNVENDINKSFESFKQLIKNEASLNKISWEKIEQEVSVLEGSGIEKNDDYKTIALGKLKYFYNMERVVYINNGEMIPLRGGHYLFDFAYNVVANKDMKKYDEFLEFCKEIIDRKSNYRLTDSSIIVSSARLNYGSAEYNFKTEKINKGASVSIDTFTEFKKYIVSNIS